MEQEYPVVGDLRAFNGNKGNCNTFLLVLIEKAQIWVRQMSINQYELTQKMPLISHTNIQIDFRFFAYAA